MELNKAYINYHKILIFGQRGVGKSTLSLLLKGGHFTTEYTQSECKVSYNPSYRY